MEFLVAGATAVQIGTANFYNPTASMEILDALPAALADCGREPGGGHRRNVGGRINKCSRDAETERDSGQCTTALRSASRATRTVMRSEELSMRVLSGIQPTGPFHWGNYFGAIRQYIALQDDEEAYYFIANLHALTTVRDPAKLRQYTLDAAHRSAGAGARSRTRRRCSCSPTCPRSASCAGC